ncbi:aspartate aminotransferase, partial [Micrococcus sp. SIMBA_131]
EGRITTGATEVGAGTDLGVGRPGNEGVTDEPFYDSHAGTIALTGGRHVSVAVGAPDFLPDPARVAAAVTDRARLRIVSTP